jgi:hypothetical protein
MAHALTQHDTTGVTVLLAGGVHVDWAQVSRHSACGRFLETVSALTAEALHRPQAAARQARVKYAGNTVSIVTLEPPGVPRAAPAHAALAYDVYEFCMRETQFDLIYFADWGGLGYYVVSAKRQGEAFQDVELGVLLSGPRAWHQAHGTLGLTAASFSSSSSELQAAYMERRTAARADVVVARSAGQLTWLRAHGWSFPAATYVASFPQPVGKLSGTEMRATPAFFTEHLVFAGPLTHAAGLVLFLDAVERLLTYDARAPRDGFAPSDDDSTAQLLAVTLAGMDAPLFGDVGDDDDGDDDEAQTGAAAVRHRVVEWTQRQCARERTTGCITHVPKVTVETTWEVRGRSFPSAHRSLIFYVRGFEHRAGVATQPASLSEYVAAEHGRWLVVMPALAQHSPRAITEFLHGGGRPLLLTDVGDAAELVHADDAPHALVPPRAAPLAAALAAALRLRSFHMTRLAPSRSAQATATAWQSLHRCVAAVYSHAVAHHTLTRESSARRAAAESVMVSVVLVTRDRPALLQHALVSLEAQDHEKLEVVLVDDGSATPTAIAALEALERPDSAFSLRGCVCD